MYNDYNIGQAEAAPLLKLVFIYNSFMPDRSSKRQKDTQELARSILDQAVPDAEPDKKEQEKPAEKEKNPAAVALGRMGGLKGGKARAVKLTPKQRSEIAKKAAEKRWKSKKKDNKTPKPDADN